MWSCKCCTWFIIPLVYYSTLRILLELLLDTSFNGQEEQERLAVALFYQMSEAMTPKKFDRFRI